MISKRFHHRAAVLIFALCVLSVLTAFAVAVGVRVRQSFTLVSRLNNRDHIDWLGRSGVALAQYFIRHEAIGQPYQSAEAKQQWLNNPDLFKDVRLSTGRIDLYYKRYDGPGAESQTVMHGLEDEGAKLNINTADLADLLRLFRLTGRMNQSDAEDLANAVLDWRQPGETEILGFYGEEYYANQTFPYKPKKAPFENLSEVQLLKGMNPDIFRRLKDFMTVYGDGGININTASQVMLMALGMSSHTAQLVVEGRKGPDGLEATADDFIFRDPDKISLDLTGFPDLALDELAEIQSLYVSKKIVTESAYVTAHVRAYLPMSQENRSIDCVFRIADGKILEWR